MVELPGIKEPERVRKLLQGSVNLEFWEDVYKRQALACPPIFLTYYHHITGRAVRLFHTHSGIYIGPLRLRHYSAAGSAVGENAVRCPVDPFRVHPSLLVFLSPATDCIMDLLHHHSCTYFLSAICFHSIHLLSILGLISQK